MLDQLARHALFDLTVRAEGDLHIDDHHTVEDTGIALGQALAQALGDKRGIRRYGECALPMDDAQVRCALDLSGRPFLIWNVALPTQKIGTFDCELVREFFQALATQGLGVWFGVQGFINMGVNMGVLPTKGLTLPFVSYGGSAVLMNCLAIAFVLRVDYENRQLMRGEKV